jgi:hypothetical protein
MSPNDTPVTEFLDHRPAPSLLASDSLGTIVSALARQASTKWKACLTVARIPVTRGPIRVMDFKPGANGPGDPGDGWYWRTARGR